MKNVKLATTLLPISIMLQGLASAQSTDAGLPEDLTELGLNKLLMLDLTVTSASRKPQKLSDVPAAVYVISSDDIKHSGATHLADLLRTVPGVNVAQVSSNKWAVSSRGFNQLFAHRLLVLEDGISVFSPTTNGVYWETIDIPLDTIERIEVIRGPGATLWGDHAVNGVVNIISKKAIDTQGTAITTGGGNQERLIQSIQQGGAIGKDTHYRATLKYANRASNILENKDSALDNWDSWSGHYRVDSSLDQHNQLTITGDGQYERENSLAQTPSLNPPYLDSQQFYDSSAFWRGGKSAVNWKNTSSENTETDVRLSAIYKERDAKLVSFNYQIINLEAEQHIQPYNNHDLNYGLNYRFFRNSSDGTSGQEVNPDVRETSTINGFIQDDITLIKDRLHFIVGSKFEQNQLTGFEYMPTARIIYTPTSNFTLWGAASRAVSTPGVFFEDTRIPIAAFPIPGSPLPGVAVLVGNRSIESEDLLAYEIGARTQLTDSTYIDITAFYNDYDNIFSSEDGVPSIEPFGVDSSPALTIPLNFSNALAANTRGVELTLNYKATTWLDLSTSYSYIDINVDQGNSADVLGKELIENGTPKNQANLNLRFTISNSVNLSSELRYVDRVKDGNIDAYIELGTRLNWQISKSLLVSVVGQNMLHDSHIESQGNLFGPPRTELQRSVFGFVKYNF